MIGSILTSTYASQVNLTGLPQRVAAEVKRSYAAASHLGAQAADRAHAAFVSAMHVALLTGAAAVLLAAIATLVLLARQPRTSRDQERKRPPGAETVTSPLTETV